MDATKVRNNADSKKIQRDDKQGTAKLEEQVEKLIKSLGNAAPPEQKMASLAKNFIELEKESNKQATALKQTEKVLEKEQREKEHLQREYNKGVLMRDKLEQVCREQQKLMKSIKSESMSKIRDEEEKRKETQAHFQKSINEIFTTLGKNNDENVKIKEANLEMTKKFKYLAEQYELREKQLEKLNEQIKLETQLNEAKLAKVQMESTIEKEILLKEKQTALEEILSSKKAAIEMETRERLLKDQLHVYTDKYDEFQNSLQRSNDIFSTYKTEMEKMSKKIKILEKESYEWRSKYEKCNRALLDMATDKQAQDQYVSKASRQLAQLQKLCRTLQAERGVLLDVLKENNIDRPVMPELPPEPKDIEAAPKPVDKLDAMSRNCKELKETLAQLQGQMNAMTIDKTDKPKTKNDATAQPNKKAKSKKNKVKSEAKSGLLQSEQEPKVVVEANAADSEETVQNSNISEDVAPIEIELAATNSTNDVHNTVDSLSQLENDTETNIEVNDAAATLSSESENVTDVSLDTQKTDAVKPEQLTMTADATSPPKPQVVT